MKNALIGFALGLIIAGVVFWGIYSITATDAERRLDESLKRGRVLLAGAQEELERERLNHKLTKNELVRSQSIVDNSLAELGRLRKLQDQDAIAIDGSLEGIERIRAIIEGLPVLE
jgi:hypothetical protein